MSYSLPETVPEKFRTKFTSDASETGTGFLAPVSGKCVMGTSVRHTKVATCQFLRAH